MPTESGRFGSLLADDRIKRSRLIRFSAVVVFGLVAIEAFWLNGFVLSESPVWRIGMDFDFYRDLGAQWITDGIFYQPHQFAGPYDAHLLAGDGVADTLYPPTALLLFIPFAYAPAILWWVIPIALTAYAIASFRPAPIGLLVAAVLLLWPRAIGAYLFGNTDIWICALVAAGLRWGWPALGITLKPTLAPLALIGARRRSWRAGLAIGLAGSLLFLPLWVDYLDAMRNLRGLDIGYSLGSLPLLAVPLVAWAARRPIAIDTVAVP